MLVSLALHSVTSRCFFGLLRFVGTAGAGAGARFNLADLFTPPKGAEKPGKPASFAAFGLPGRDFKWRFSTLLHICAPVSGNAI